MAKGEKVVSSIQTLGEMKKEVKLHIDRKNDYFCNIKTGISRKRAKDEKQTIYRPVFTL